MLFPHRTETLGRILGAWPERKFLEFLRAYALAKLGLEKDSAEAFLLPAIEELLILSDHAEARGKVHP